MFLSREWVDFALKNSRRTVEKEVRRARQEAKNKAAGQQTKNDSQQMYPRGYVAPQQNKSTFSILFPDQKVSAKDFLQTNNNIPLSL